MPYTSITTKNNRRHVEVKLTGESWQLFTASMKCGTAANALNKRTQSSINKGLSRDEVEESVFNVMSKYSRFGAFDTEPREVLATILDEVYGRTR